MGSVSNSGGGTSSSVSEVTSTVRDSHLFVSHVRQSEAVSSVGGSLVFDLERSNREGSGSFSISRFLLPSFLLKMSFTAYNVHSVDFCMLVKLVKHCEVE